MRPLLLALAGVLLAAAAATAALRSPVDRAARQAVVGITNPPFTCASPPPIRDAVVSPPYSDGSEATSADVRARYERDVRPIKELRDAVARAAEAWIASDDAHTAPADCLLALLDAWASAGALFGRTNQQGAYERKFTAVPVASAWALVRARATPDARDRIDAWVRRFATAMQPGYEREAGVGTRNNHLNWAAVGVTAVGVAVDDRALFDWGLERARRAIDEIQPDGTLPLELARGSRALHYHAFALGPLLITAELAATNGTNLYGVRGGALGRLAWRVAHGMQDPASFARLAGEPQVLGALGGTVPGPAHLAWMEPWYRRTGDALLLPWLRQRRPLRENRLGGDLTLAYGVPQLP